MLYILINNNANVKRSTINMNTSQLIIIINIKLKITYIHKTHIHSRKYHSLLKIKLIIIFLLLSSSIIKNNY